MWADRRWSVVDLYLQFDESRDELTDISGPPYWLAVVNIAVAIVALVCHLPGARAANWIGYVAGAWAVPVLAIVFYGIDRKRSRARSYIPAVVWNRVVNASALSAIAIGFVHAYFASQSSYYG